MLVLTRCIGEKLCIGDNIVVTLVDIKNKNARIGIEAPEDVRIYREEILPSRAPKVPQWVEEKKV